jgi:histidinol-phosphate aminotransferase
MHQEPNPGPERTAAIGELVPDYVRNFQAYIPNKPDRILMREYGAPFLHRLNNNENPLGPPPAAQEAIAAYPARNLSIYPNGDSFELRQALSQRFGFPAEQFLVGNGSTEAITSLIKAFCQPGDDIVTADKTFAVYEWVAQFSGIEARLVPLRQHAFDPEAMLARLGRRTKIVFLCNPNNPTGTYWPSGTLVDFLERAGGQHIVVIDEAYCEYVDKPDYPDAMRLIERFPNVVVFRTFSKMYGLAGLRAGFMVGSAAVIGMVRRTANTYSVNSLAQIAAQAALADDCGHIARSRQMALEARAYLSKLFDALELPCIGGEGSYIMVKMPVNDALIYRRLMRRGFMVRPMTSFRFPGWVRVTLRELEVMDCFAEALTSEIKTLRRAS